MLVTILFILKNEQAKQNMSVDHIQTIVSQFVKLDYRL